MRSLIVMSSIILAIVSINLLLNVFIIVEFLTWCSNKNKETPSISDIHLHGSMFLGNFSLVMRILDFEFRPRYII